MKKLVSRIGGGLAAIALAGSMGCATARFSPDSNRDKVLDCTPVADLITDEYFACKDDASRQWSVEVGKSLMDKALFFRKDGYDQARPLLGQYAAEGKKVRIVGTYSEKANSIEAREIWFGDEVIPLD